MSCELSRTTLHGYIDGELDAVRAAEFENHLESCPQCRATRDRMESLRTQLRESNLYEYAPAGLRERVHTQLFEGSSEKRENASGGDGFLFRHSAWPRLRSRSGLRSLWFSRIRIQPKLLP